MMWTGLQCQRLEHAGAGEETAIAEGNVSWRMMWMMHNQAKALALVTRPSDVTTAIGTSS